MPTVRLVISTTKKLAPRVGELLFAAGAGGLEERPGRSATLVAYGESKPALAALWKRAQKALSAELDAKAEEIARKLASGPARAYAEGKALMNASLANSFPAQLLAEAEAFSRCAATDDFIEGATSFAEKRKPKFKGR